MQAIPAQMILPDGSSISSTNTGTTTTLIPIEISERLMIQRGHTVSIVELGKKLLLAAREGNTDIVRELMGKGAPFTADWLGTSPLHFAALNNHLETCEILLRAGISRDSRTKVDRTPLHMAAYNGHVAIVQILLSSGADVEARDMLKMTPLHWAVQNGHADVVTILLKHGANSEPVNKFDKTPLDIAIETNRIDILQLLQIITKDPVTIEPFLHNDNNDDDDDETLTDFVQHQTKVEETTEINHEILEIQSIESQEQHSNTEMTDSIQILKDHGITFLPVDDHSSSVVASAVENGHQLVLTEVGKQVLNSTKHLMKIPVQKGPINKITSRKIITVTADQLLAMASSSKNIYKKIIPTVEKPVKRIVMNKNKFILSGTPNVNVLKRISTDNQLQADFESITRQLQEARRQAEEYKKMLKRKEEEAELYKKQLLTMANLK